MVDDIAVKMLNSDDISLAIDLADLWAGEDSGQKFGTLNPNYVHWLLDTDHFYIFVALKRNCVIGGLTAYEIPMFYKKKTEIFLYEIGVASKEQNKGAGKKLIGALKDFCLQNEISCFYVPSMLENNQARKFYMQTGGSEEKISWFTYDL